MILAEPTSPALSPTLYFIGVTTSKSSIMKVFPAWAKLLGLKDTVIQGIDFPLHADPNAYRRAVAFIKADPLSRGALVTTHKLDLFAACRAMFDEVDDFAALMGETSCLSKRGGRLICHAKDPISSGLALNGMLGAEYFSRTGAEAFCIGAGGSGVAITWNLMRSGGSLGAPARITVSDRSQLRLDEMAYVHRQLRSDVPVDYVLAADPADNDAVTRRLRPGSLVINATGLGKDAPGSPLTGAARFPERGVAWDLNYRGELVFLDQARATAAASELTVVDGWTYFLHGWTQVIAEVFDVDIPTSGAGFEALSQCALAAAAG